jgi:molybdate transport system substrate-binding protein
VRLAAVGLALALLLAGCGGDDGDPRLVVSAGSSMTEPLTECSRDFEGADVRLSFGGSDELAAQVRQGVKPDVLASANTAIPEALHEEGLLSEPVEFATNRLVIAVPRGSDVRETADLRGEGMKLVIGSESVPIGSYTREALSKLPREQEEAILANVVSNEPDVKGIVGKLTQGAGDAGFVYVTDVNATGGDLKAIDLPDELDPVVTYGAGVPTEAREPELGQEFLDGLTLGPCATALEEAGFGASP